MEGEVARVLQLAGSSVVPIMYQVPRKVSVHCAWCRASCRFLRRAQHVVPEISEKQGLLTDNQAVQNPYNNSNFPFQSYRDFHADLYPDTAGAVTYLSAPMWLDKQDCQVPNISLNPNANNSTQVYYNFFDQVKSDDWWGSSRQFLENSTVLYKIR